MGANRKLVFASGEIYHVYNRGVEKRRTFVTARDYERGLQTFDYYRLQNPPLRFSHYIRLSEDARGFTREKLNKLDPLINVLAYCFMPNHFHFLLRQAHENGISKFIANFTNSYTKYFNTKNKRVGHLFQGTFKAVRIGDEEQLVHVLRYIHLNPVSSFIIEPENLSNYSWSSHQDYINENQTGIIDDFTVMNLFTKPRSYESFVRDQIDYTRNLEMISHLILEDP